MSVEVFKCLSRCTEEAKRWSKSNFIELHARVLMTNLVGIKARRIFLGQLFPW